MQIVSLAQVQVSRKQSYVDTTILLQNSIKTCKLCSHEQEKHQHFCSSIGCACIHIKRSVLTSKSKLVQAEKMAHSCSTCLLSTSRCKRLKTPFSTCFFQYKNENISCCPSGNTRLLFSPIDFTKCKFIIILVLTRNHQFISANLAQRNNTAQNIYMHIQVSCDKN